MIRPTLTPVYRAAACTARCIHSGPSATSYDLKYADKLQRRAQEKGLELEKLKSQAREEARRRQKEALSLASLKKTDSKRPHTKPRPDLPEVFNARKDSSPLKPLSSILNLSKLMATPHTSSQISALWTAYHASRNKGTGRGFICASIPLESYSAMTCVARKYPVFVVPVPRESTSDLPASGGPGTAHEFFFSQWDFHPAPPAPSALEPNPFELGNSSSSPHIPEPTTVLFTPLQEYKHRTSFATPYLVLTFYTDLSQSHGLVLLRGEITPSSTAVAVQPGEEISERFLLSQVDAQLLAMGLQKFYLWGDGGKDSDRNLASATLLKQFHEDPEEFNWQDLLKSSSVVA